MKESNSFTKEYLAEIECARHRLLGKANGLSANGESSNHIISAINIINKLLELHAQRILTIEEISFLDTIIGITYLNNSPQVTQARIVNHLEHYNELVNEIDPPQTQNSWFTNLVNYITCTNVNSVSTIHPCPNSGLTEQQGELLFRSAAPDIKEIIQKERKNSCQETYKIRHQTSSDSHEPSFSGDLKMHDFDHGPDGSGTCA